MDTTDRQFDRGPGSRCLFRASADDDNNDNYDRRARRAFVDANTLTIHRRCLCNVRSGLKRATSAAARSVLQFAELFTFSLSGKRNASASCVRRKWSISSSRCLVESSDGKATLQSR